MDRRAVLFLARLMELALLDFDGARRRAGTYDLHANHNRDPYQSGDQGIFVYGDARFVLREEGNDSLHCLVSRRRVTWKRRDVGLFRETAIGVKEPLFGMVDALPGLKWRMAALAGTPCAGAFHQQTIPGVCDARSAMAGLFLRLRRLDDNRPCAKLIDGTVSPLWLRL